MNIKVNNPNINDISCKNTSKTFGQVVVSASSTVFKEVAIMSKNIQVIAQKIGVEIIFEGSQIHLEKEIDGKIWRMLTIDNAKKAVDVVVDIKRFRRSSISSGLTADDMRIPGYTVRQVHEVRGPLVWLLNADSKGREIVTPQGKRVFVKMVLEERKLRNGDIVRYNTWDFSPYALYEAQLSEDTILCESPEHKREFILQLADDFCSGRTNLEDKLSPEIKERTILINGLSKAYAMTGWRLGYACGPEPIIKIMTKIHQSAIMSAPTTSQYAAITALKECDGEIDRMRDEYNMRRRLVVKSFNDMGLTCFEPRGAFYAFPCIKSTGMSSQDFCTKLLEQKHVAIIPGDAFGASGEGYARISYAYSVEHLKEALRRIREFLQENGIYHGI